jgi:superoxide dismutase
MSTEHDQTIAALDQINKSLIRLVAGQEQIHTLVNSNLTAQMNDTLDARVRDLASLKEIVSLKEEKGQKPSAEALQVIETQQSSIDELRAKLRDRAEATEIGAEQAEKD